MSGIRQPVQSGLKVAIQDPHQRQTTKTDFGTMMKNKAGATNGYNTRQLTAYNKQMLNAVKEAKPLLQSPSDQRTVAAVVPGALGVLQPSGPDLAKPKQTDSQMMTLDLQSQMQNQQRAMQTMSNIMKSHHDTAKAIINNLR